MGSLCRWWAWGVAMAAGGCRHTFSGGECRGEVAEVDQQRTDEEGEVHRGHGQAFAAGSSSVGSSRGSIADRAGLTTPKLALVMATSR